ncbi:MAG: hypothetical protein WCQ64_17695, partial [Acidobacteriota bacterium]
MARRSGWLFLVGVCVVVSVVALGRGVAALHAQAPPAASFSADEMLKVVTASVLSMTDDGRLIAVTERRTYDNAETDNFRYGDPTFITPSAVRLVVIDTTTGQRSYPLGDRLANVRQAEFSRDGKRLAVIAVTLVDKITLHVGPAAGTLTPVAVKDAKGIAFNSAVEWTADGSAVIVSLRAPRRDAQA